MSAWCRSPKGLEMQRRGTFSVRFPSVSHHFFIFLRWAQDYHIGQRRAASGLLSAVSCPLWSCVEFENSKLNSPSNSPSNSPNSFVPSFESFRARSKLCRSPEIKGARCAGRPASQLSLESKKPGGLKQTTETTGPFDMLGTIESVESLQ